MHADPYAFSSGWDPMPLSVRKLTSSSVPKGGGGAGGADCHPTGL